MLGKFDSLRDSALHFLCLQDWGNESTGDVTDFGLYVWRISNSAEDVATTNEEFNSLFDPVLLEFEVTEELRKQLVGHFIVFENSNGQVSVLEFPTEEDAKRVFAGLEEDYDEFLRLGDTDEDEDEDEEQGEY
jgi:hypothetical protein